MTDMHADKRFKAFCSPYKQDIFQSITHLNQVWLPDPYDVPIIHQKSRECFERLLNRLDADTLDSGRTLLLLGESGSGKTHLMRVFRNQMHERGRGYFAYMQMTSSEINYARYTLRNTIDSLDKPYYLPTGNITGLMRLSNALIERTAIPAHDIDDLHSEELSQEDLINLVHNICDRILNTDYFRNQDPDLIQALLYLQNDDPTIHARVFKYLRCEALSDYDRKKLGGIPARTEEDDPQRMLQALANLIHGTDSGALVICLDQIEDMLEGARPDEKVRRAIQVTNSLAQIPNVIIVIACLADIYTKIRGSLTTALIDRLEQDPPPNTIYSGRHTEEIQTMVATRLQYLYENQQVEFNENEPLYPFLPETPALLNNQSCRQILHWCCEQREKSIATGIRPSLPVSPPPPGAPPSPDPTPPAIDLSQHWSDHLTRPHPVPETEPEMLRWLARSLTHCEQELNGGTYQIHISPHGDFLNIDLQRGTTHAGQQLIIGLCQKSSQGGALAKQIDQLQSAAGTRKPIAIRSGEFPANPKTKIAIRLGEFIAAGGQRALITDSDWRAMVAMDSFRAQYEDHPEFLSWLHTEQPLLGLPSLQQILNIDTDTDDSLPPTPPDPLPPSPNPLHLKIGMTRSHVAQLYTINPAELVRHAAFLGGSGSGKTTLALNIIEQLLLQRIPAILLDRKGDLCSYALEESWRAPIADPERKALRDKLRANTAITLYTPGTLPGRGHALSIPIVPTGLEQLTSEERQQLAIDAAFALGKILGYKDYGQDKTRIAVLGQAIRVLSELDPNQALTLPHLIDFIHSHDPLLLNAIGKLDSKLFGRLVADLQTLSLTNGHLFSQGGEMLNMESLLGNSAHDNTGKTRLSIINTSFLGNDDNILFWVAQLLLEIGRFTRKSPSNQLQAVILLDEADLYLPAQSKPATKDPLENLLKRARSAGIGLMLATQSPGDLDYKSRDQISSWFIGRITQKTAIEKLRPMFTEASTNVADQLPNQTTGEFYVLHHGQVTALKADTPLVRIKQIPSDEILKLAVKKTEKFSLKRMFGF